MCVNVLSACIYVHYMYDLIPVEVRSGYWIPQNWSYRRSWAAVWMLSPLWENQVLSAAELSL